MAKAESNRREFLQLADTYSDKKHKIAGFLISEKLDGTRCFWDGGISRGVKTENVPYAGITDPKTGKRKAKIKPYATGLWSRYGNPIIAPDWFLNSLPCCPLDGELWAGRGKFQLARSICAGDDPDPRFDQIQYAVYGSPPLDAVFRSGEIKGSQMVANLDAASIQAWVMKRLEDFEDFRYVPAGGTFDNELMFLREIMQVADDRVFLHQQIRLPEDEEQARKFAYDFMDKILDQQGEGCIIRDPQANWTPKRHKGLLKFKPYEDAEAVIIGYKAGEIGKTGNMLGKIGAIKVRALPEAMNGCEFALSGMKMNEREFVYADDVEFATNWPGKDMPPTANGKTLKLGDKITFKYRELTDDGIPKEARYWRKRDDE